jgi:hypothetical protein
MAYRTRLTPNTNDWKTPSGRYGKCPGINNWECLAGFGFEEWYRSELFRETDEKGKVWQYGYWQCFQTLTSHPPGEYIDFTVHTRVCPKGCTGNNKGEWYEVAHYKRVFVLSENERASASIRFANGILQIRKTLGNLGVDVVSNFDSPPINYYKFNIKFLVEEEDYRYNNKKQIFIHRGGARFKLYQ